MKMEGISALLAFTLKFPCRSSARVEVHDRRLMMFGVERIPKDLILQINGGRNMLPLTELVSFILEIAFLCFGILDDRMESSATRDVEYQLFSGLIGSTASIYCTIKEV
jgi:hypothetical protein